MNDLATLTGAPAHVEAGGESHDIHPLTLDDLGQLQAWVDAQRPDPFEVVSRQLAAGKWSLEQQKHLLACAVHEASQPKPRLGTPEAAALLNTITGRAEQLYMAIRKGEPDFSRKQALEFYEKLNAAEVARALSAAEAELATAPKA